LGAVAGLAVQLRRAPDKRKPLGPIQAEGAETNRTHAAEKGALIAAALRLFEERNRRQDGSRSDGKNGYARTPTDGEAINVLLGPDEIK